MKYYEQFLQRGCFTFAEAAKIVGNEATTRSLLYQYIKRGYLEKVRRGLYVAIDLIDHEPVANKFVIASKVSETAVVSHHSAFEFHGYTNQVSHQMSVTSDSRFNAFEFRGLQYIRKTPAVHCGVICRPGGERVTDVERTVLDMLNDFEHNMGFEELIQCIAGIPILNEARLLEHLSAYDKCFLYQKAGFVMEHFRNDFGISGRFLQVCKENSGNSSRYLMKGITKENMEFNNFWHLTVPRDLWQNAGYGGEPDAII